MSEKEKIEADLLEMQSLQEKLKGVDLNGV